MRYIKFKIISWKKQRLYLEKLKINLTVEEYDNFLENIDLDNDNALMEQEL